ncbi:MmgE/PrpD family protein [Mesobaculum littorinae]|uniref:MmgE/PrpD family protein n=1 Tax=Mesobaculum littorinae TaxID=2486419 RepID=A0A438ADR3_9RHOB|nr:MmgE/PrpD family protein [Mesobaculum littorinae]RVV96840.1 MmgE/PrpD family protein [Mesobaculum littorinae]
MTHSQELAAFVCDLASEAIPASTRARARQLMTDTLGVGLSGSRHPNFQTALDGIAAMPAALGDHPVIGSPVRLSAPYAALVNGVACHVLDFDDTHTASIVHGSAILTPLVLALGEETAASGRDVQAAFVAGWEVAARVGIASGNSFHNRGFHSTAIAGVFGATAAAGKLLGLTAEQMTHAFGLAGSQASGVTEFLTNSSSSKGYHVGWAARNAMEIAYLARAGATGPQTVFEGANGLLSTHGLPDLADAAQLSADLGTRWETERVSIKPYPCCHFAHGAIDCAIGLRADGIAAEDVQGIHAIIDEVAAGFVCKPIESKYVPTSAYGAKFSLPFLVATGLIDGQVTQGSFDATSIARDDLLALARRVTYEDAEKGTTGFPKYFPGHLVVTLTDGRVIEKRVAVNRGNPDAPLSDAEVAGKFRQNVDGIVDAARADALVEKLASLEELGDLSDLTRELVL